MESESILQLRFSDDRGCSAEMTLATSNELPPRTGLTGFLPDCISPDGTVNVPCVSEKTSIDGSTPIMIYTGDDRSISPILLLEETEYEVMLHGDVDSAFDYILENSGEVALRRMHLHRSPDERMYTLSFHGYVGKGWFDVTSGGREIKIPFEVRSKKIDYLEDYPIMLADISEFSTSLLMGINSPLYGEFGLGEVRNDTLYEDFMLLDHIFGNRDLVGAYNLACSHRHSEMRSVSETVPAGMACDVDPSDLTFMISQDNLIPMDGGPIAGAYSLILVSERNCIDDLDTPENRVVKDLIVTVQRMVHQLISNPLSNGSSYICNRLAEMRSEIDVMASDPWLDEVGDLTMIPFGSTVLQSRAGYSELFSIYQMIGLGVMFRQDDLKDLLKGQNNRVYQVYEYWCYTRLYRSLHEMSDNKPQFPLDKIDGRWTMSIRRGNSVEFSIPIDDRRVGVTLYYNRKFDQRDGRFRSYSIEFRPDFTLMIRTDSDSGNRFIINFDAKYKAKPDDGGDLDSEDPSIDPDCWEFDIYKMHTYRDALLHSFGSYILYPGRKGVLYPKPLRDEDWNRRDSLIIPSVGAVPLIPGSVRDYDLDEVLKSLLYEIAGVCVGESDVDLIMRSGL